jgi:hypothetical protein
MIYLRPRRIGLRTAQAARLAKKLNDAADGRLVACVTMSGELVINPDLVHLYGLSGLGDCPPKLRSHRTRVRDLEPVQEGSGRVEVRSEWEHPE